jgi:hypothetical protein
MANIRTPDRSYKLPEWLGICTSCGRDKEQTSFGSGRAGECNTCAKSRWNANNAVKLRAQRLHGNAQKRAKANGWPIPDFGSPWIEEKIVAGVCEVTGILFDLTSQTSDTVHAKNPWVPSIDRIDSSKPYTKDNVQLVVYMYNVCKSEFAHKDVVKFCRAVVAMETEIA